MSTFRNGLILTFFVLLSSVCGQTAAGVTELGVDDLTKLLDKPGDTFLLDVREPAELAKLGTIKGYVNIPLAQLEARSGEVPKDRDVVTFCNRAGRAAKAATLLNEKGCHVVAVCGLEKIKEQGGEKLVTERPEEKK